MAFAPTPYCGAPPVPGDVLQLWNLDPVLIGVLALLATTHLRAASSPTRVWTAAGWLLAGLALVGPLCPLSVALFSARIGQHMILILIAAPLIAFGLPGRFRRILDRPWAATAAFAVALWFWHMPRPYEATFDSTLVYWTMHLTLVGSAIWLWSSVATAPLITSLAAGTAASMQMGLLGALLTLAPKAIFPWHFATAPAWGYSPLQDQQLGGLLMWVPGCLLFAAAATLAGIHLLKDHGVRA